ncbi:MAG: hypothetical protein CL834_01020 [Crocinitomicaceae bacterium]|nr:hypothetical protein [Crocinitomicaceae bacterium]
MRILVFFLLIVVFPLVGFAQRDSSTPSRNKAQTSSNQAQKQSKSTSGTNTASDSQRERYDKESSDSESNQDQSSARNTKNGSTSKKPANPSRTAPPSRDPSIPTLSQRLNNGKRGPTYIGKDGKEHYGVSFGLPTFEDHSAQFVRTESQYPIALPVMPIFQASMDDYLYADVFRRVSFVMIDELFPEIPSHIGISSQELIVYMASELNGNWEHSRLIESRPRNFPDQSALGTEHIMAFRAPAEGDIVAEDWIRHVLSIGRHEGDDGGYHYIQVYCHYPKEFETEMRPEVDYYFDNLRINEFSPKQ